MLMARRPAAKTEDKDTEEEAPKSSSRSEEVDEDGVVIRNKTTVDVDPDHVGVHLGDPVENWRGEYEEIPPPTLEERAEATRRLMALDRGVDPSAKVELTRADVGHDYEEEVDEGQTGAAGLLYPTYD